MAYINTPNITMLQAEKPCVVAKGRLIVLLSRALPRSVNLAITFIFIFPAFLDGIVHSPPR